MTNSDRLADDGGNDHPDSIFLQNFAVPSAAAHTGKTPSLVPGVWLIVSLCSHFNDTIYLLC
jgi:hypothetical protein